MTEQVKLRRDADGELLLDEESLSSVAEAYRQNERRRLLVDASLVAAADDEFVREVHKVQLGSPAASFADASRVVMQARPNLFFLSRCVRAPAGIATVTGAP